MSISNWKTDKAHPINRYTEFFNQLSDPSQDRSIAITACAYLDDSLSHALMILLNGLPSKERERAFSPTGFLGPIGNKLDLALGIGLLPKDAYNQLVCIARIRNRFAHNLDVKTFDHPDVSVLIDSLSFPASLKRSVFMEIEVPPLPSDRRSKFSEISRYLMTAVHNMRVSIRAGETTG